MRPRTHEARLGCCRAGDESDYPAPSSKPVGGSMAPINNSINVAIDLGGSARHKNVIQ